MSEPMLYCYLTYWPTPQAADTLTLPTVSIFVAKEKMRFDEFFFAVVTELREHHDIDNIQLESIAIAYCNDVYTYFRGDESKITYLHRPHKVATNVADDSQIRRENARLRARLTFLEEDSRVAISRATAKPSIVNGVGQYFCPSCLTCIWEPPNIPPQWRHCRYANIRPPDWCPHCGQHQSAAHYTPVEYEEDPIKKQYKGDTNNGNRNYRR